MGVGVWCVCVCVCVGGWVGGGEGGGGGGLCYAWIIKKKYFIPDHSWSNIVSLVTS